jgi:hypothetical protein
VARCDLLRTVFQLCQSDDSSEKVPFFVFIYLFLHFNTLEVIDMRDFVPWRFDPILGHGVPLRALRLHTLDTPHSVGLLWTSDQPDTEIST